MPSPPSSFLSCCRRVEDMADATEFRLAVVGSSGDLETKISNISRLSIFAKDATILKQVPKLWSMFQKRVLKYADFGTAPRVRNRQLGLKNPESESETHSVSSRFVASDKQNEEAEEAEELGAEEVVV